MHIRYVMLQPWTPHPTAPITRKHNISSQRPSLHNTTAARCLKLICFLCMKMKCTLLCIIMAHIRLSEWWICCLTDDKWMLKLVKAYSRLSSGITLMHYNTTVKGDNLLGKCWCWHFDIAKGVALKPFSFHTLPFQTIRIFHQFAAWDLYLLIISV